jgi:ureidoacrylate peracid hydrolase
MSSRALILVDFENEWIDPKSDEYIGDISKVIKKTNSLLAFCRKKGFKIIFTRHVEKDSKDAWSEKSGGTKLINELEKKNSDVIVTKNKISPFFKTDLEKQLKGIDEIVVCGILTNLCVRSLIHDAYDRDFNIKVIKDCCATYDNKTQEFTFKDLKATREEVEFFDLNEFIAKHKE